MPKKTIRIMDQIGLLIEALVIGPANITPKNYNNYNSGHHAFFFASHRDSNED